MRLATWLLGIGLAGATGCTAIAGLDGDYSVGDVGGGGVGASGAAGGSTSTNTNSGGSTSTSTNSGGSGGSGATGGGGGSLPVEDCLDGIDNDGNMLVDCADPACQPDYECVPLPAVPSGWTGYYILDSQTYPAMTPQPCPDTSQPDVLYGGPGGDAQCSACACGNRSGGSCTFPELDIWYNTSSCNGGPNDTETPTDGNCHPMPQNCSNSCNNDQRAAIGAPSAVTGNPSCPPSGGTPTVPPLWMSEHHICDLPPTGGGGCQMGEACVSMGTSFGGACIQQAGAQTCPSGFAKPLTAYNNASDDRACSSCTCGTGSLSCTTGEVTVSDDNNCMGGGSPDVVVTGNNCESIQNLIDQDTSSYRATAGTLGGTCTPQGGGPTGSVTPSGEVTFCCL